MMDHAYHGIAVMDHTYHGIAGPWVVPLVSYVGKELLNVTQIMT